MFKVDILVRENLSGVNIFCLSQYAKPKSHSLRMSKTSSWNVQNILRECLRQIITK